MIHPPRWATHLTMTMALSLAGASSAADVSAYVMDMKIDSVETRGQTTSVTTTGAQFVFDQALNRIVCHQRIPQQRQVVLIGGLSLSGLTVQSANSDQCVLATAGQSFTIGGDSLLRIGFNAAANVDVTGSYAPKHQGTQGNNLYLPDQVGGVSTCLIGGGSCTIPSSWNAGWTAHYRVSASARLLVSVYPPRPFDWKQASETMLHSFSSKHPYPSDQELEAWRKIGPVLTLHGWIWRGAQGSAYGVECDDSWATTAFVPKDVRELRRVVNTAHRLGMKVIPYMSPYYFGKAAGGATSATMPQFLAQVQSVVKQYDFDGVYFDGLYANDIEGSYEVVRRTRQIIGQSGILHVHNPGMSSDTSYPFINAYASYILNGEHQPAMSDDFARWIVSDYNLGNSIGTYCYTVNRPSQQMIDTLLADNARLPYWVSDGTWAQKNNYLSDAETALMNLQYLPRVRAMAPEPPSSDAPMRLH